MMSSGSLKFFGAIVRATYIDKYLATLEKAENSYLVLLGQDKDFIKFILEEWLQSRSQSELVCMNIL